MTTWYLLWLYIGIGAVVLSARMIWRSYNPCPEREKALETLREEFNGIKEIYGNNAVACIIFIGVIVALFIWPVSVLTWVGKENK